MKLNHCFYRQSPNWAYCFWAFLSLFSCSVMSDSLQPHGMQHARPPCPSPTPGACIIEIFIWYASFLGISWRIIWWKTCFNFIGVEFILQCCVIFCCTANWVSYIYIFFFIFFSIVVCHKILTTVPCAYNWILLFIHPIYDSVNLLIPNSQSFPPPPTPWQPQVCTVCLWAWFYFVDMFIFIIL